MSDSEKPYPEVVPQPRFPELEERVLARWRAEGTFQASVEARGITPAKARRGGRRKAEKRTPDKRTPDKRGEEQEAGAAQERAEFVFYDGPPFANGLPHFGHLLTGYAKDVVPRYQTMRGKRVERRFGWDCHGLPVEIAAEKQLGVHGRAAIQELGIEKFNATCRGLIGGVTEDWRAYVDRQARWVDLDGAYRTMDLSYMESVIWAFKQLWEKELVYESFRVMPYSWAAETPVSNFETRLDNSYRERQDPAITVAFELVPTALDAKPTRILVWTTTPWTLPSNLALAVGEEIQYELYETGGVRYVIGAAVAEKYASELEDMQQVGTLSGAELVGRKYTPLFPYFAERPNAFRILAGDFVDTEEGTGVVHLAPGFGEDDQRVCAEHGIEVVCPVDSAGRYTSEVTDWAGVQVFEANKPIIANLKERGLLLRHETYLHNYPHCWRTDEPLIYRALSSWYVKVTDLRDRMVEHNQDIHWIPEHIRDGQFGKWLEGARDWSISRNRFWGTPLPVWRSDDPAYPRTDVYGSLDELEADFGVRPTDLHREHLDALTRPNPDDPTGASTMRRVDEVFDCWFESGSMPFASVHYPFENEDWFESHFPGDFVVEYVAQTRGWFYTMMVLSTALFDRQPFKNCICHGIILGADGQKVSKRLRNYADPMEMFDLHGSDAMRWYLMSAPVMRGGDMQVDKSGKAIGEVVRLVINPIWNAWYFFALYANADGLKAVWRTDQESLLDRYILAKTRVLVEDVTLAMDAYDLSGACAHVRGFLDALNNWYIRRSRQRFWQHDKDDAKQDAYDTLYTVLEILTRVAAPLLPLIAEEVHTGLTGGRSVHLEDWPDPERLPADPELVLQMDRAREVCSTALGLREEHRLRVRLPLPSLTVTGAGAERLEPCFDLIRDEVNVKEVRTSEELDSLGRFDLKVNARVLGPRLGGEIKVVLAAARAGEWTRAEDGVVTVAGHALDAGEYDLRLLPNSDAPAAEGLALGALSTNDAVVALDTRTTPELELEGIARDLVRLVQTARKEADLDVSDRIDLRIDANGEIAEAIGAWQNYIMDQTLAKDLLLGEAAEGMFVHSGQVLDEDVAVGVVKSS